MMEWINLSKVFDGKTVINDVNITVREDEYLTLLGPSGSGKSVLLRLVAGLEWPDSGTVKLDGEDIGERPPHLRGLGFVQQKYALFPHLTVYDNVAFGLLNREIGALTDQAVVKRKVSEMLDLVGLKDLGGRMVGQISGGQKQRVSLARTLVTEPKICLLDEPLGALDANLRERMTVELRRIRETLGVTFVHATGNETEALAMGERVVILNEGRALQLGLPDEIYDLPATVDAARTLNAYNLMSGSVENGRFSYAGTSLPLPAQNEAVRTYAIRFGQIEIEEIDAPIASTHASIEATFITSEFIGSRMVYFFHAPNGELLEVEEHLSKADPRHFDNGEKKVLTWPLSAVLTYDSSGALINNTKTEAAA